ncbi:hypothetical protein EVAR_42616_1 [Eumeta japonica]|uniref:Uncharacterized protein n=1 Tax=Eumeta variegata TaxID=151549 RepID=A0A4C1XR41_EUMVA|nr:hypothetical protein EVAR_42616_1 [Eumeta japonica]
MQVSDDGEARNVVQYDDHVKDHVVIDKCAPEKLALYISTGAGGAGGAAGAAPIQTLDRASRAKTGNVYLPPIP